MSTIFVQPVERAEQLLPLVRAAVNGEIVRLEMALNLARTRLLPFESKYGVTSEHFIEHMSAEDLEGSDDEYVQWAGEYHLMQRLEEKLVRLQEVEYSDYQGADPRLVFRYDNARHQPTLPMPERKHVGEAIVASHAPTLAEH